MSASVAFTTSVDPTTAALVEQQARARGLSVSDYVAESLRRVAESEADFQAFIQVGMDDIAAGRIVPHEQVMAELDAMIADARSRCGG